MKKFVSWVLTAILSVVIVATLVHARNRLFLNQTASTPIPFSPIPTITPTATPSPTQTPIPTPTTTLTPTAKPATPTPIPSSASTPNQQSSSCDPNYSGCVPMASDVDCAGGSGNGPAYVKGPINVTGNDIYDLDRDDDGIACE